MIKDDGIVRARLDLGVDYYKGEKGDEGFSPSITTTEIDNGYTLTITNKDGEESIDILNGRDGGDTEEVWNSISELEQRVNEIPINTFDLSDRIAKGTGDKSVRIGDISNDRDSGKYSVSQGYNSWAYGSYSHAEGNSSIAAGGQAHAEGNQTHAQGMNSHAEGISTYAYDNAHAEGIRTIARAQQHAEGKYNVDLNDGNVQAVIGNGSADNIRSNMLIRDWDGNVYISGNLLVNCSDMSSLDNANQTGNDVATALYVDDQINDAFNTHIATTDTLGSVKVDGSTITIDSNGVISASSSGSGSSYTFTHGLSEDMGVVSWDLHNTITAGTGTNSVIEGNITTNHATGQNAHAEGNDTSASGNHSHAEGVSTQASNTCAHAEGISTHATGAYSHAEGWTTWATGSDAHAEGSFTSAGNDAHAEGRGTIANSSQHAEGKYNISDRNNKFQHIVGNGTDETRSNSFARDWDGNEYLAGKLYVNCNNYATDANGLVNENANGSEVATKDYVDNEVQNCYNDWQTTTEDLQSQVDGINTRVLPEIPAVDGSYKLTTSISSGTATTEWTEDSSSSGESYTAGDGISIDSNNVISTINYPDFMWLTLRENFADEIEAIKICQTKQEVIDGLNAGKIVYLLNAISDVLYIGPNNTDLNNSYQGFLNLTNYGTNELSGYTYTTQIALAKGTYLYAKKQYIFRWKKGNLTPRIQYNNNGTLTTLGGMFEAINTSLANKQDAIIPTPPSTDGNYILTCAVNNGSITYTWVDATIGGTY